MPRSLTMPQPFSSSSAMSSSRASSVGSGKSARVIWGQARPWRRTDCSAASISASAPAGRSRIHRVEDAISGPSQTPAPVNAVRPVMTHRLVSMKCSNNVSRQSYHRREPTANPADRPTLSRTPTQAPKKR
jgi:hypothetical protein